MAIKKSEIYGQIWAACDKLRGGVEPARYKDYILTLLFVKYVSDRYKSSDNWDIEVPEGGSFDNIVELKYKKNIGEGINIVIGKLAEVNELKGIIDIADFNSEELGSDKEAVDKLSGLVEIFQKPELDFTNNRAGGDDILGDAYEFLMRKFAQDSGKSKGQFYTPGEVSRIMAKVIGICNATDSSMTVYDPACGSGSLLIRAADEAPCDITIFGQEKDNATAGLARMNLVLHNRGAGEIAKGSTITSPKYKNENNPELLKTFDYIVVNPPFSDKSWTDGIVIPDTYGRYTETDYGVPPEKNGDYAWLLHVLKSLKSTGKAAIILPHGVLFRGNAEADIRKKIIDHGYIKGIIGLPANLFYGTGIPACIIVIDKEDAINRKGIFMIDASKEFVKDGNKNRLREQDIHKIVTTFLNMDESNPKYARFVSNEEIKIANEYNLNLPRYIDSSEPEDLQDINAHLNGGIPAVDIDSMDDYWTVYPNLKEALFQPLRENYYCSAVNKGDIVHTITSHEEFIHHADLVDEMYLKWKNEVTPILMNLTGEQQPKVLIEQIAEKLLNDFGSVPLLDKYDVYQVLMEYWAETMQDDVYAVCYDGYETGREISYDYGVKKKKENGQTIEVKTDKVKGFEGKIIPRALLAEQYFQLEVKALDILRGQVEEVTAKLAEMAEENGGEDGAFSQLEDLKRATVIARVKAVKSDLSAKEELDILQEYVKLLDAEADYKKAIKQAETDLDTLLEKKYPQLTVEEIKHLLIEEKWFNAIYRGIDAIHSAVSHRLSKRVTELVERYEYTLKECEDEVTEYEKRVKTYLKLLTEKKHLTCSDKMWEKKLFGDVFEFMPTNSLAREQMGMTGTVKNIHYGDILTKYGAYLDANDSTIPAITDDNLISKYSNASYVQNGDIIIANTAEDDTVGKAVEIINVKSRMLSGQHTMLCRPREKFAERFLGYYINSVDFHDQMIPYITGIKVSSISKASLLSLEMCIPPIEEQTEITQILTDIDNEIEQLEKKLAKYRQIKQGMMQELLTGHIRLVDNKEQ